MCVCLCTFEKTKDRRLQSNCQSLCAVFDLRIVFEICQWSISKIDSDSMPFRMTFEEKENENDAKKTTQPIFQMIKSNEKFCSNFIFVLLFHLALLTSFTIFVFSNRFRRTHSEVCVRERERERAKGRKKRASFRSGPICVNIVC